MQDVLLSAALRLRHGSQPPIWLGLSLAAVAVNASGSVMAELWLFGLCATGLFPLLLADALATWAASGMLAQPVRTQGASISGRPCHVVPRGKGQSISGRPCHVVPRGRGQSISGRPCHVVPRGRGQCSVAAAQTLSRGAQRQRAMQCGRSANPQTRAL